MTHFSAGSRPTGPRPADASLKNEPRQVARAIVDGIERDEVEVLAGDDTRHVRAALSGPIEALPRMG